MMSECKDNELEKDFIQTCDKIRTAASPNILVTDNSPVWLSTKINEMEVLHEKDISIIKVRIFQGEWENRTVYFIFNSLSSCMLCEVYREDGGKLAFEPGDGDVFMNSFCMNKNWKLIYEFGNGLI
jgi:hypothetical protein